MLNACFPVILSPWLKIAVNSAAIMLGEEPETFTLCLCLGLCNILGNCNSDTRAPLCDGSFISGGVVEFYESVLWQLFPKKTG